MPSGVYRIKVPVTLQCGDIVTIRGMLKEDAKAFSVNFCLPRPPEVPEEQTPPYIAYHFKTIFNGDGDSSTVVQNWKNVTWHQEVREKNYWHSDRSKQFAVVFQLNDDEVRVYSQRIDHAADYVFELNLPMTNITTIELWGDVKSLEELSFKFPSANGCRRQDTAAWYRGVDVGTRNHAGMICDSEKIALGDGGTGFSSANGTHHELFGEAI